MGLGAGLGAGVDPPPLPHHLLGMCSKWMGISSRLGILYPRQLLALLLISIFLLGPWVVFRLLLLMLVMWLLPVPWLLGLLKHGAPLKGPVGAVA